MSLLKQQELNEILGVPITKVGYSPKYLKTVMIPDAMRKTIPAFKQFSRVTMHSFMIEPFFKSLQAIIDGNLANLLTEYGGCFCVRSIRGVPNIYSIHSWGLAFDINMSTNGLGKEPQLDARIVAIFKDNGFNWGGDWKRKDGMHFELSKETFDKYTKL